MTSLNHAPNQPVIAVKNGEITLRYFSRARTIVGIGNEHVTLPQNCHTVESLIATLGENNSRHQSLLNERLAIKVAVNHEFVEWNHPIKPGDELAFFPPVTGG